VQRGDHPVLGAALTHRDVEDAYLTGTVVHGDDAVEELRDNERLDRTLREGADVEQARCDDGTGFDGGDAGEREEDAALSHHPRLGFLSLCLLKTNLLGATRLAIHTK